MLYPLNLKNYDNQYATLIARAMRFYREDIR